MTTTTKTKTAASIRKNNVLESYSERSTTMTTKAATSIIRKNNAPDRSHHVARGLAACLCIFGVACVFDLLVTNIGGALIQQQTGGSASGSYSQFALTVLSGTSQGNDEVAAAELSSVHSCSKGASMESIAKAHFKSQNGEDKTLLSQWFHGLCNGTYVEMGALNGVKYSNSYVFNKAMGWKGLLVELSPTSHRQLVANRPNELVEPVNVAVCKERQMIHYYVPEERLPDEDGKTYFMAAVAGIWEFNSREHREKWWPNVTIDQTTPVECVPMKDLLRRHVPERKFFDFCE